MKKNFIKIKTAILFGIIILFQAHIYSEAEKVSDSNDAAHKEKSNWSFSEVTDFAYYPKSDYVSGDTHFAPITGAYDGIELRTTAHATYTISIPFSDNLLFLNNTFSIDSAFELTPISIMPKLTLSFTPIAFFNLKAGANLGTAWELLGIKSLASYNSSKAEYEQMDAFKTWYYQFWICGTLMFDTAALFPGDWNHVVIAASYELNYSGLLNEKSGTNIFQWQTTDGMVEGFQYASTYILGYQMPLKVSLIGAQLEFRGYINDDNFDEKYKNYCGDFLKISVSPLVQIKLNKKDSLFLLASISSRRSFKEDHNDYTEEPLLTKIGREWYFYRVACSWTHNF